jgi:hypothetical protein
MVLPQVWLVTLGLAAGVGLLAQASVRTFDADRPDAPPPGFTLTAMRQPTAGVWSVRREAANGFLVHRADPAAPGFALAVSDAPAFRDGVMSVRLRLAGGARAGGLVWRYHDADNFHAIVLDLTARSLAMYRVVRGNRVEIEDEDNLELDPAGWHVVKVVHDQALVRVSLGGIRVFEERERTFGAGRVGLLATGASEVWFDDLKIEPERRRP